MMRYLNYAPPLDVDFGQSGEFADRLLQRSFELVNDGCSLATLKRGTGLELDEDQFARLQEHVTAFDEWLVQNFSAQKVEKNFDISSADQPPGSRERIDLAESEAGFWLIVRHPCREDLPERFAELVPQLLDYRERIMAMRPYMAVMGIVVDWVYAGGATIYPVHRYV